MSQEQVERRPRESRPHSGATEILEKKLLQVGNVGYHVEMKQNGDSRFITITEEPPSRRQTRVVVPMCISGEICKRLLEMDKFASTYTPANVSEKKGRTDKPTYAHSLTYKSMGGRVYYFDLIDAQGTPTVKISYVFAGHRNVTHVYVRAIPKLAEIIEKFSNQYPSLSPTDDYPASRMRTFNNRRGYNDRRYVGPPRGYNYRPFRSRPPRQYNGNPPTVEVDATDTRRFNGLKVLSDPAPCHVVANLKHYTVEIVQGDKIFFRITESINDTRRSTLHVPVESIGHLHNAISEMNKKYQQTQKTTPPSETQRA